CFCVVFFFSFFFQAEDGIRDFHVTGVQTCALPISKMRVFELLKDPHFTDAEKLEILLHMFTEDYRVVADLNLQEKLAIVNTIFDRFIIEGGEQGSERPPYDLEKDAEYIYASFMYDYGID